MDEAEWTVEQWLRPGAAEAAAVRALASLAADRDGIAPLNDEAVLALDGGGSAAEADQASRHFAVRAADGSLIGYAYLGVGAA
ncbi:MAG: hypothetical protein LBH76_09820, partial [Propionibacteriaceae bacterium]|nr:hypothetical protein [Propionibacteriaceae bacterium]